MDRVTIAYIMLVLLVLAVAFVIFLTVYNSPTNRVRRRVAKEDRAYARKLAERDAL